MVLCIDTIKKKYEKLKSENDAEDEVRKKKRDAYEKLGYDVPDKYNKVVNRDNEDYHKKTMNFYDTHKGESKLEGLFGAFAENDRRRGAVKSRNDIKGMCSQNNPLSDKQKSLHAKINKRAAIKEAIDLLYDKAANADTLDEATMYIDRAEQLESMIEE